MIWTQVFDLLRKDRTVTLVTLAATAGSAPREAGACMLVAANGDIAGTIGGGALEWQAIAEARRMSRDHPQGRGAIQEFVLGPDLGQCCGGRVSVLIETFAASDLFWIEAVARSRVSGPRHRVGTRDERGVFRRAVLVGHETFRLAGDSIVESWEDMPTPLFLFGAGHVGRAVILALAPLPFSVRWIDAREELFPTHVPRNVETICATMPHVELAQAEHGSLALVMTHSHAQDLELVAAALRSDHIQRCGLIGSETKRARFISQLARIGIPEERIEALACPIGLPELGKGPAAIAAGIVVDLLRWRNAQDGR